MKIESCCRILILLVGLGAVGCKKDKKADEQNANPQPQTLNTVPEFYSAAEEGSYGQTPPTFKVIATSADKLDKPQDLDFHTLRPTELWVINKNIENTGGSTLTISNAGKENQNIEWRRDQNAWHFMSLPSGIAFSDNGDWATTPNVQDANHQGGTFTGPSLWSGDMNIYAKPSGGNGSHLDMVHSSPYSMGIAAEKDYVFWVNDGYNGNLVRYDFVDHHGPGNDYHSDALVHRYSEVTLRRNSDVPGHLILDHQHKWLYIADAGNKRVIRVNIQTGNKSNDLPPINEPLAEIWEIKNVEWESFQHEGFDTPCGIEIVDNRLFVSDYETGDIIAYNVDTREELGRINTGEKGIMGIKVGPEGKLWYVNALTNQVVRIDPS